MKELLERIRSTDFDLSSFKDMADLDIPIIILMICKDRWIGVGQFYCPMCELTFNNSAALAHHRKACHEDKDTPHEQAAIEYITNMILRWKIEHSVNADLGPKYRCIFPCPVSGCSYMVNRANSLSSHIGSSHIDLVNIRSEVGTFWAMHILHARRTSRLLYIKDVFHDMSGSLCRSCNDFIGKDLLTVRQHSNRSHPHANLEGHNYIAANVFIRTRWMSRGIDDSEIEEANSDLTHEKSNHITQKDIQEVEKSQPIEPRSDDSVDLEARERRRLNEESLRRNRSSGVLRTNERTPDRRLHRDRDDSSSDETEVTGNTDHITSLDLDNCLNKADNWKSRCMNENTNIVHLPKLWGDVLAKHKKVLSEAFATEVKSIITWYENILDHAVNIDKYKRMLLCDGMIAKIVLILRKTMRSIFRPRKRNKTSHHPTDLPIQLRSATKFTAGVELLHTRLAEVPNPDQPTLNLIADIKDKLLSFLSRAPDEFTQLVGGTDLDSINSLLSDDNYEERMKFLRTKLEALEIENNSPHSSKFTKFIQRVYDEDAKRALDWFVLGEDTPECIVPVEEFVESYGSAWSDAATLGTDHENEFTLNRVLSDEDNTSLNNMLIDEEEISRTIRSRSNLSAAGCDGLCNGIWKVGGNLTVKLVKLIIECMLNTGLFPEVLKLNKTIMLFKKGDQSDPHSWRPITITPTLYRIIMCHISRTLQLFNSHHRFISSCQKGFMKIPAATAEHASVVDEMIHDAVRGGKSLYIMTIDFSDAFGSIPHKLIKKNLRELGFSNCFIKSVMSSYKRSSTRVVSNGRLSDEIVFRKGVKQGCPMSPTLFNICLDSLVSKLDSLKDDGYHWFDRSTVVQAYADDIILFSDTEVGMNNLIEAVESFCLYAGNMRVNSKKCQSFTYIINNGSRQVLNDNFVIQGGVVDNVSILGSASYLGLPIAAKASRRKRHVFRKIEEMTNAVSKITSSSLRVTQAVDAIKRFVLPTVDYELMANTAPVNGLRRLDQHIRGKLSKMIKASGIPIDWFYTSRRDGGLNLQCLCERQKALTIRLYVGLVESNDKSVRNIIKASDDAELIFRDAEVDENSPFLGIKLKDNGSINGRLNRGTSNLLSRCVKSLFDLNIGLSRNDDTFVIKDLKTSESTDINVSNVMKNIMKIICKRHQENLCHFTSKGHSFNTLKDSPVSSFFLKPKTHMADSIVKFAIRARTNSLMTGSLKSKRINPTNQNYLCKRCGGIETLHHILNGCPHNKASLIKRHDTVQSVLSKYLIDHKHLNVHQNQSIRGRGGERIDGPRATLRPDLWWWENDRLMVAEFTIPYGMLTDLDGESISTLTVRRNEKIEKYSQLINDCKSKFNCDATLLVFVISSLGACPAETLNELKSITGNIKDALKLAARMVAASIRESMFVFMDWMKDTDNEKVNDVTDDTINSTSDADNEINPDSFNSSSMNSLSDDDWHRLIEDDPNDSDSHFSPQMSPLYSETDADSESDVLTNAGNSPLWAHGRVAETASSSDVETVQHSPSTT